MVLGCFLRALEKAFKGTWKALSDSWKAPEKFLKCLGGVVKGIRRVDEGALWVLGRG